MYFGIHRTFVLSVGAGFAALGTAPTYWLGGYISHRSSVVTVFWWKLITAVTTILYVLIVLPESFSVQERQASRRETELRNREAPPRSHNKLVSVLRRPLDVIESILEPLKYLKPSHDAGRGRHNFRLLTLAIASVLTNLAVEYIPEAWFIYTTVRFQFKPEDVCSTCLLCVASLAVILVADFEAGVVGSRTERFRLL
jgi:MFS family permease